MNAGGTSDRTPREHARRANRDAEGCAAMRRGA